MYRLFGWPLFAILIGWAGTLGCTPARAQSTASLSPDREDRQPCFPNAIYIDRNEAGGLLSDLEVISPYGLLSVLSLEKGLTFMTSGDIGAETWFNVRGFGRDNSRLILMLLDGRTLNLATNHTIEFDDIPVNIIDQITIYPGPVPVQYGGYQTVIDIKTIHNEDLLQTQVVAGSRDTYRMSAVVSKGGRFHYLAQMSADMSKADSYKTLSGVLSDFQYGNRQVATLLPTLKMGYEITRNIDLVAQAGLVDYKKMYDSALHQDDESSRRRKMQNYTLWLKPGRESQLDYAFSFFHTREKEHLHCVFPENTEYNMHWGNQKRYLTGLKGYYRHPVINGVALKAGGEAQWTEGNSDDDYLYFVYKNRQNYYSAFLQSELNLWKGGYVNAGIRMDGQKDVSGNYFSPVFAASQSVLGDRLTLYATYGVTHRWIPLNEVNTFYQPISTIVSFGPPVSSADELSLSANKLNMERTRAFDAGIKGELLDKKLNLGINYFYMKNKGQLGTTIFEIAEVTGTEYLAMAKVDRNFPGYDISHGMEFEAGYAPLESLRLFANATYYMRTKTERDKEVDVFGSVPAAGQFVLAYDGNAIIPGAYTWLSNAGVIYKPVTDATLNAVVRYRSKMADPIMKFGNDPGKEYIGAFATVDIAGAYNVLKRSAYVVKVTACVSNLFDRSYQTFIHYPMSGRFVAAGFTVTLK